MEIREIKDFKDYYVSTEGKIFSKKSGKMKELSTWNGKHNEYQMVGIVKNNKIIDGFLQFLCRMIEVVRNLLSLHDAEECFCHGIVMWSAGI